MSNLYAIPTKAIKSVDDLVPGMLLWQAGAGGVVGPQVSTDPVEFIRFVYSDMIEVCYMKLDYNGEYNRDCLFDGRNIFTTNSLLDRNVVKDNGYNDWYFFTSKEDAEQAVRLMLKEESIDPTIPKKRRDYKNKWDHYDY